MKKAKKVKKYEPTITDVLEAVQTGFAHVDGQFDKVEGWLSDVGYRMTAIEKRAGSLEDSVEDLKETLGGVARAIDKDTVIMLDHERRIRRLEKARA